MTHSCPTRRSADRPMMSELREAGLDRLVIRHNPDIDKEVARNMWALSEAEIAGKPAKLSGTEEMQQMARIRSAEHPSELQSLMRIPYAVFCLSNYTLYFQHIVMLTLTPLSY